MMIFFYRQSYILGAKDKPETGLTGDPDGKFQCTGKG